MAKELETAYSAKEKAELLLSNLEKLKVEVSVIQSRYDIKADYTKLCDDAILRISEIRADLEKEVPNEHLAPTPGWFQSIIDRAADCIEFGLDKMADGIIYPAEKIVNLSTAISNAMGRKGKGRHST